MDEIKVGDVYKSNNYEFVAAVISKAPGFEENNLFYVLFSDGDASDQCEDFKDGWHKIGHIDKFAESLKELEEIAKSGGD